MKCVHYYIDAVYFIDYQSPRSPWSSREDTNDLRLETNGKLTVSELAGELQMEDSKSSTIPHPAHTSIPNQNGKTEEERYQCKI